MVGHESATPANARPPRVTAFRRRLQRFRRLLPRHLSAAWLGAALLYLADLRTLPEPVVAFVVSTGIAIVGAVIATVQETPVGRTDTLPGGGRPGTTTDEQQPGLAPAQPAQVPPAVRPGFLDVTAYPAAAPDETQCPRCGSFAVHLSTAASDAADASCRNCGTEWRQEPCAPPDVVVRSWLHH